MLDRPDCWGPRDTPAKAPVSRGRNRTRTSGPRHIVAPVHNRSRSTSAIRVKGLSDSSPPDFLHLTCACPLGFSSSRRTPAVNPASIQYHSVLPIDTVRSWASQASLTAIGTEFDDSTALDEIPVGVPFAVMMPARRRATRDTGPHHHRVLGLEDRLPGDSWRRLFGVDRIRTHEFHSRVTPSSGVPVTPKRLAKPANRASLPH